MIAFYLTHPQVEIEPDVPVPDWRLSATGRARMEAMAGRPWLARLARIVASTERKAIEAATILARPLGLTVETAPHMGENDRSATGFLPPDRFEQAADRFFAAPDESFRGWERARDAQARVVAAMNAALATNDTSRPLLFVGHGAVGTLLKCHLAGRAIDRREDQPPGGGNLFAFRLADRSLLCDWTPAERFDGDDHGD